MKKSSVPVSSLAPAIRAASFLKAPAGMENSRLTDRQREDLARIGMRLRLPARMVIYRENSTAQWIFAVAEGAVKCYRDLPSGKRAVGAFLFGRDVFGLAENGRYVNCAQAVTSVTLYRLPVDELTVLFKHDPDLQLQFLVKVAHELRASQRRAIVMARRDAAGRLAMFLAMMVEQLEPRVRRGQAVPLPMSRSDIGGFLGLSLEAVCRAAAELERRGLVEFETRHLARIVDPVRLARLAAAV